ncbi:MAG TPA: fluoride efflux transporter CrcB [Kribbella sp.]|uniref:fluoride efflux transporter CrcB n=1 Tax=Kribbella sp. TaxID=1871183 RepID=UPI002D775BCE|nr:fluoride efflux transporter CrcB [Kribbella sp.]HET6292386.1 fluoride efflux transporter CrcB [Kribbella sp.]
MTLLLVAAGAAVGAPLRYLVDRTVQRRRDSAFPWGTLTVNVMGSFVLGLLTMTTDHTITLLLGVGFCGAFTTYSTFGYETIRLAEDGSRRYAVLNVVVSLSAGLTAAILGVLVARVLS